MKLSAGSTPTGLHLSSVKSGGDNLLEDSVQVNVAALGGDGGFEEAHTWNSTHRAKCV